MTKQRKSGTVEQEQEWLYTLYLFSKESVKNDPSLENLHRNKRLLALKIWDLPFIKSNKISKGLYEALTNGKTFKEVGTHDHRNSGAMIRNHLLDTDRIFSLEEFKQICKDSVIVNYVLKSENTKLKTFQNKAKFNDFSYYADAKIELFSFEGNVRYDKKAKITLK